MRVTSVEQIPRLEYSRDEGINWNQIDNSLFRFAYDEKSGRLFVTLSSTLPSTPTELPSKLPARTESETNLTYDKLISNWVEVADIKNYKVNYNGVSIIAKPSGVSSYINWGGHNVCIRGKDSKNQTILFNEQSVFEKANDIFYKLLNQNYTLDSSNLVTSGINTNELIEKLSYDDWGYLHELNESYNTEGYINVTNMRKFGCTIDISIWGKNEEEVNRICYFPDSTKTNKSILKKYDHIEIDNDKSEKIINKININKIVMGICWANKSPPNYGNWTQIKEYFNDQSVKNHMGGYKNKVNRYKIKYN